MGREVLVVGDLNPDLLVTGDDVVPRFGQRERYAQMRMAIGGSAAICAAGLARLGVPTALAATVGDDDLGAVLRRSLAERGVDTAPVRVLAGRATGLSIHFMRGDDRAILTERGTIGDLEAVYVIAHLDPAPRHVHIGSLYLLPGLVAEGGALLEAARRAGATVSVDTNDDPSGAFARPDWLTRADVLVPNEAEALALAGRGDGDVDAAAADLGADGALVVVKRGPAGALAVRGSERWTVAAPVVDPVDAVGAGDSFDAGLIAGLLGGRELPDALALACACGALSTREPGGVDGQPTLDEAVRCRR
jgi:sugar/nucleoside kinase (ribokinase family)